MTSVHLNRVSTTYGTKHAIVNLSLDTYAGKLCVVLGKAESGKTALARLISGLDRPRSGEVLFDATNVTVLSPRRRKAAMVFSQPSLYPMLSVFENIEFPLKVAGIGYRARRKKVRQIAAILSLGDVLVQYPHDISIGTQQKVALARAIVRDPAVLVLDDPLTRAEQRESQELLSIIRHLQHEMEISTIYFTADSDQAMSLADQLVIIEKGRVVQASSLNEVISRPANVSISQLIGSPAMNLIHGGISDGVFRGINTRIEIASPDRLHAIVGVHPESLRCVPPDHGMIAASVYSVRARNRSFIVSAYLGEQLISAVHNDRSNPIAIGQHVGFYAPIHEWYVFDGKTGTLITSEPVAPSALM